MSAELLVLRLVHVLGGIFWVGGGLYSTLFIVPAIAKAGPAAGPIMAELHRRKLFTVLPLVAVLTMLSGIRLLWIVSDGFAGHYFHTMSGHIYAVSGGAAIVGFLVAMFLSRPASVRMGALGPTIPSLTGEARAAAEREMQSLGRKASIGTAVAVGLLTLSAAGMAVARYL
jgi:uncharacterized membrane protein